MASRFPGQRRISTIAGHSVDFVGLSEWRRRLATVATTLVELLRVRPVPVPVRVTTGRERRLPRR